MGHSLFGPVENKGIKKTEQKGRRELADRKGE
jgi:hypothetical protein